MKKIFTLLALFALPFVALGQDFNLNNGSGLFDTIQQLINFLIPIVIGVAIFIFIFGLLKYVNAGGDEDKVSAARNTIIWGLIIIFVMFSAVGIVNLLNNTFGFDNQLDTTNVPQI